MSVDIRTVAVAAGETRAFDEAEWRDALVVVERGAIELECRDGSRHAFGPGEVLWLSGLTLTALHNRGRTTTLLVAISRVTVGVQGLGQREGLAATD